ncbi:tRNA dihydrouridine synthase [Natronoflexus pectinivorans]|uniref:tRNA-dihydrouridine synthase n=1 Tax=Natronoflexus pectinivorans TaxID=682526 RepID=A0A4R2GDQ5_9BACT|nr:tRNA-dihydrouridine synthase family protein [Natronoflexus pectinivorans]TCO06030.1 tRNA-dihydrouridine synthase [Natronoflexus pectinivorans]
MKIKIHSTPLQGFTDFRFRNNFHRFFGGIDAYYAPYIRFQEGLQVKSSYHRDLLPEYNIVPELIPQIMTNSAEEFLFTAKYVQEMGYKELNWNLGCPYPMVAKRALGSGLIKEKDRVDEILKRISSESDINISIKLRLGYENNREILDLLPVLNKYQTKNLIIHPRIGKQLYKGSVDLDTFRRCTENTNHNICFNGDIDSPETFSKLQGEFPNIREWAIGRGIIANPFLPAMIRNSESHKPENWSEVFGRFHDELFREYEESLSGSSHILVKMKTYWEYFSLMFSNPHKVYKIIKKAGNIEKYKIGVSEIIQQYS